MPNSGLGRAGDRGRVVPGGIPENPLKARWLGIFAGAGIHGTDATGSIGSAASHGCIRMLIPDVIELYDQVPVGAPIYIADLLAEATRISCRSSRRAASALRVSAARSAGEQVAAQRPRPQAAAQDDVDLGGDQQEVREQPEPREQPDHQCERPVCVLPRVTVCSTYQPPGGLQQQRSGGGERGAGQQLADPHRPCGEQRERRDVDRGVDASATTRPPTFSAAGPTCPATATPAATVAAMRATPSTTSASTPRTRVRSAPGCSIRGTSQIASNAPPQRDRHAQARP